MTALPRDWTLWVVALHTVHVWVNTQSGGPSQLSGKAKATRDRVPWKVIELTLEKQDLSAQEGQKSQKSLLLFVSEFWPWLPFPWGWSG